MVAGEQASMCALKPVRPLFCEGAHEGAHGNHEGNGYAISNSPEDRRPPGREIRHPAISCGPDDDLADFAPDLKE